MTREVLITAAELSRQSNTQMRKVQTWTNAGALLPVLGGKNPGRGATRLYAAEEIDVAKMLGAIDHHGIPVKEVKSVAEILRGVVFAPRRYQYQTLDEAVELRRKLRAQITEAQSKGSRVKRGAKAHTRRGDEDVQFVEAWIALEIARAGGESSLLLQRTLHGWRLQVLAMGTHPTFDPPTSGWRAGYALNLGQIFGGDRGI